MRLALLCWIIAIIPNVHAKFTQDSRLFHVIFGDP